MCGFDWNIIFSGIVAFSTIIYAALTGYLVFETRKIRVASIQPQICISIVQDQINFNILNLEILNAGHGPAKNIRLVLKNEFEMTDSEKLSAVGVFQNGIPYMAPSQKIVIRLAVALHDWDNLKTKEIIISTEYKNILNSKITEIFQLRFDHFDGLYDNSDNRLTKITESLGKIENAISAMANGTKKLKIIMYSVEDVKIEEDKWNQRYKLGKVELSDTEPNEVGIENG